MDMNNLPLDSKKICNEMLAEYFTNNMINVSFIFKFFLNRLIKLLMRIFLQTILKINQIKMEDGLQQNIKNL